MQNEPQVQAAAPADPLSWASMLRTCRVTVGVLLLIAIALLLLPQTNDMLSAMSDRVGYTVAFQFALWLAAISAWFWSRTVLSARADIGDGPDERTQATTPTGRPIDVEALNLVPRLMFIATALVGLGAELRSLAPGQAAITVTWTFATLWLLANRLRLQERAFGRADLTAHGWNPPAPEWMPRWIAGIWETFVALLAHSPFGRAFAAILLLLGLAAFVAGAVSSFLFAGTDRMLLSWWTGYIFAGPSAVLFCLALALGPLTVVSYYVDLFRFEGRLLGINWSIKRVPVLAILVAIVVVVPAVLELHRVRISDPEAGGRIENRRTLSEIFPLWVKNCIKGKGPVRPIIVAISGGASAAGLWGARALAAVDELTEKTPNTAIFAVSSVSGGSLGAAAYFATLDGSADSPPCKADPGVRTERGDMIREALGSDFLGPFMAAALIGDVPRGILGAPLYFVGNLRGGDRAEGLEQAFERRWAGSMRPNLPAVPLSAPFMALFPSTDMAAGPIWIANGTDSQAGNRLLTVPFRPVAGSSCADREEQAPCNWPFHAAKDVISVLKADVPISTAVHNTARFPFLSPSGALVPAGAGIRPAPTQIVDGGYFDNEGLLTALELSGWLSQFGSKLIGRDVNPIIVQVTTAFATSDKTAIVRCSDFKPDDPLSSTGISTAFQFFAPLSGLNAVRGGHGDAELRQARIEGCSRGAFFHFYLFDDAGHKVPMNWALSKKIAGFIWKDAIKTDDNCAEYNALRAAIESTADACKPETAATAASG